MQNPLKLPSPPRNEKRSSCTSFSCLQFWKSLPICDVTQGNDISLIRRSKIGYKIYSVFLDN